MYGKIIDGKLVIADKIIKGDNWSINNPSVEQLIEKGEKFIIPLAQKVGLDTAKLSKDAASAKVKKIIDEDMEEAKSFGFDGAPYVLVNNLVLEGAPSTTTLNLAIDEALKLKK